jgi:hypothetical protein
MKTHPLPGGTMERPTVGRFGGVMKSTGWVFGVNWVLGIGLFGGTGAGYGRDFWRDAVVVGDGVRRMVVNGDVWGGYV